MDLNYYFDPVSLDKPDFELLPAQALFGRNIHIHTPDTPVNKVINYDVAINFQNQRKNSELLIWVILKKEKMLKIHILHYGMWFQNF
jgi:hypothetical protein